MATKIELCPQKKFYILHLYKMQTITFIRLQIACVITVMVLFNECFAQGYNTTTGEKPIIPGVYNTTAGNYPISIKINDEGNIIYKDYRETVEYVKTNLGKYTHSQSVGLHLLTKDGKNFVNFEDNSDFRREFKLYAPANAKPENGAIAFTYNNDTYYAIRTTSSLFCGLYKYPGKEPRFFKYAEGEPIILLNDDQSGEYQTHGTPAIPIKWWIESDYKGKLQMISGALADRYYLVVQFGPGSKYSIEGNFDRMILDVYKDGSKVVILGERVKELKQ